MEEAYLCDGIRTPVGRYGGVLSGIRTDDLASIPLKTLMERNPKVDWETLDDIILGCANQAGEDNRNVARMASLLSGLPHTVPGATVNRLCGSGLDAIGIAARAVKSGEQQLVIAGGVAANRAIFETLSTVAQGVGFAISVPPAWLCTDNAAMIAWAALERRDQPDSLDFAPRPRWPLDPQAAPPPGRGVRS